MMNIGIFCSASENIESKYFDAADELGSWIGRTGRTLVYGGASLGLMECVANSTKQHGGKVIGVVPSILEVSGRISQIPDETVNTRNLSDRKDIIAERSDILVALPGGLGTLDEIFHVMAAATIGYHDKKVVFYNVDGFYDDLINFLMKLDETGFSRRKITHYFHVANTLDELTNIIELHS